MDLLISYLLALVIFACPAIAQASRNITIAVPNGTSYYQNTNELCFPTSWTDIITFFGANYFAHAATIRRPPGNSTWIGLFYTVLCLLFPICGLFFALDPLLSFATFAPTNLQMATRAGALVMVGRTADWKPADGDSIEYSVIISPRKQTAPQPADKKPDIKRSGIFIKGLDTWKVRGFNPSSTKDDDDDLNFHLELPEGYGLYTVPVDALVEQRRPDYDYLNIRMSYNTTKVLVAIVQLLYALSSLYKARDHQILRFGYAAFGLTVAPYAIMSLVNLTSCLFCPDFETVYLVHSRVLEQAVKRSGKDLQTLKNARVVGDLVEFDSGNLDVSEMRNNLEEHTSVQVRFKQGSDGVLLAMIDCAKPAKAIPPSASEVDTKQNVEISCKAHVQSTPDSEHPDISSYVVVTDKDESIHEGETYGLFVPGIDPYERTIHPVTRLGYWLLRSSPKPQMTQKVVKINNLLGWSLLDISGVLVAMTVCGGVVGIIGGLSNFQRGESTLAQRVWIMLWLATNLFWFAVVVASVNVVLKWWAQYALFFSILLFSTPAIGGFVVVGQMLRGYGSCTLLP